MKHPLYLTLFYIACMVMGVTNLKAQSPALIKDISIGHSGFDETGITINGVTFMSLDDQLHGEELWKTDATEAGTLMVKDVWPGSEDSYPSHLAESNGVLYFSARDSAHGTELWKSDGTETGTVLIRDIEPGTVGSSPSELTSSGGTVYFTTNSQIWKTDGTEGGTKLVKNTMGVVSTLHAFNGEVYFFSRKLFKHELWKTNGTEAGTVMLKNIYTDDDYSLNADFEVSNGLLYFIIYTGHNGADLWKTDGTSSGTQLIKNYFTGNNDSPLPMELTDVNGTLFFSGIHMAAQWSYEIWKSDGTEAGTQIIGDIFPYNNFSQENLTNFGGTLFFFAEGPELPSDWSLWSTDGTESGTKKIIEKVFITDLYVMSGLLYFGATTNSKGTELWVSDGTPCGTQLVSNINPGSGSSNPNILAVNGSTLIFSAVHPDYDNELWKYDHEDLPPKLSMTVAVEELCPGDNLDVSFVFTCEPEPGNIYSAELSDASGNFNAPVTIGSLSTQDSEGIIGCHIPSLISAGSGYRIRLKSSAPAETSADNESNITITCPVPINLSSSAVTAITAKLKWDEVSCAEKYQLQYRISGDSWIKISPANSSKKITGLLPSTNYDWKVKSRCATDPNAFSSFTSVQHFTTGSLKQSDDETKIEFSVYPNPASSDQSGFVIIQFTLANSSEAEISLFDLQERKIKTIAEGNFDPDASGESRTLNFWVEDLANGIYFLQLKTSSGSTTQKLIIQ